MQLMEELRGRFIGVLDCMFRKPDSVFKEFLDMALKLWDYRESSYGIECIFQTYVTSKLLDFFRREYELRFSEKIPFGDGVDIRPDLVLVREKKIKLVMEMKCIEDGCLSWVFSNDGTEKNKDKGDICRLLKIKDSHQDILCYELIVNRGQWNSGCWGNKEYENLKRKGRLKEVKHWEFDREKALSAKLLEIMTS